jgi:hypothetical protein
MLAVGVRVSTGYPSNAFHKTRRAGYILAGTFVAGHKTGWYIVGVKQALAVFGILVRVVRVQSQYLRRRRKDILRRGIFLVVFFLVPAAV